MITPYYNYVARLSAGFKANEIEVPEDMSVVELTGLPPLSHHPINATCTVTPMTQIADRALQILVEADTAGACHYVYQPHLHIGSTTAAPSGVMV